MDVLKTGLINSQKIKTLVSSLLVVGGIFGFASFSNALNYSEIEVADLTSKSFTVTWQVDEPSTPGIEIYTDVMGTEPATGINITTSYTKSGDDVLAVTAENNGVMRVLVSGLQKDTPYFYKLITSPKSGDLAESFPAAGALPSIQTKLNSLPFSNESFATNVFLSDNTTAASGTVVVLNVEGSETPISYMVGDGYSPELAALNLTNLYEDSTQERRQLAGGEIVSLRIVGGLQGEIYLQDTLPVNNDLGEFKYSSQSPIALQNDKDSDDDGLSDSYEIKHGLDPFNNADAQLDSDSDGLTNEQEFQNGTNPNAADTDDDGLSDSEELTNGTLATDKDSDKDGLSDHQEIFGPIVTDALNADSDGDGSKDGDEIAAGTDPNDSADKPLVDDDGDLIDDTIDNCPGLPNTNQSDNDSDGQGDVCDSDDDNDGIEDAFDNAPYTANPEQSDADYDGIGDVIDNCVNNTNEDQEDYDMDGQGDVCDPDDDNDGINDYGPAGEPSTTPFKITGINNFIGSSIPGVNNESAAIAFFKYDIQTRDTVLLGRFFLLTREYIAEELTPEQSAWSGTLAYVFDYHACRCYNALAAHAGDTIVIDTNQGQITIRTPQILSSDLDSGGFYHYVSIDGSVYDKFFTANETLTSLLLSGVQAEPLDNCQFTANSLQEDSDNDGIGNACDTSNDDVDGDGVFNDLDNCPSVANATQSDLDGDGTGDLCDELGGDYDLDGIANEADNCPNTQNADQADGDTDGLGDACDADTQSDNDGINDLDEITILGTDPLSEDSDNDGISDADEDFDFDGVSNIDEILNGTNPNVIEITLEVGENFFSFPVLPNSDLSAFGLLYQLGGADVVSRIEYFDTVQDETFVARYENGVPSGDDFAILENQAYRVTMQAEKTVAFDGVASCSEIFVETGTNWIGINCPVSGTTAFDVLTAFGGDGVIASLQRYNTETQEFETASYDSGSSSGVDFAIVRGEGYIVEMLSGFTASAFVLEAPVIQSPSHTDEQIVFEMQQNLTGEIGTSSAYVTINGEKALITEQGGVYSYSLAVELQDGFNTFDIVVRSANNLVTRESITVILALQQEDGTFGDDILVGTSISDDMDGKGGEDIIYGLEGNDDLDGGNDSKKDILIGGPGNDYLYRGDVFVFALGDGSDTISNIRGDGRIIFKSGINPEDLSFSQPNWRELEITYSAQGDQVVVKSWTSEHGQDINFIEFDDIIWDAESIREHMYIGTNNSDTMYSSVIGSDTLWGYEGGDRLYSYGGSDILIGGPGNDTLEYGQWSDIHRGTVTFIPGEDQDRVYLDYDAGAIIQLAVGDGIDYVHEAERAEALTLYFTGDISVDDISLRHAFFNDSLETIEIAYGYGDLLTIFNVGFDFSQAVKNGDIIFDLTFENGESISGKELLLSFDASDDYSNEIFVDEVGVETHAYDGDDTVFGTPGNDILFGDNGNDTLIGQGGNDTLIGGAGNDTLLGSTENNIYAYNLGDGNDVIQFSAGSHKIIFGENILPSHISLANYAEVGKDSLFVHVAGTIEAIKFEHFWPQDYALTWPATTTNISFEFLADGTVWDVTDITSRVNQQSANNDKFYLYGWPGSTLDDPFTIRGGQGDDVIVAGNLGGNTFIYEAGDGRDIYDLADVIEPSYVFLHDDTLRYSTYSENNHWDLSSIDSSRATFHLDGDALVVMIDSDPSQALVIKHFFSPLEYFTVPYEVLSDIVFADRTYTADEIMAFFEAGITMGKFVVADELSGNGIGSDFDDTYVTTGNTTLEIGAGNDLIWRTTAASQVSYLVHSGAGVNTILNASASGSVLDSDDSIIFQSGTGSREYVYDPMKYGLNHHVIEYDDGESAILFLTDSIDLGGSESIFRLRNRAGMTIRGVEQWFQEENKDRSPFFNDGLFDARGYSASDFWALIGVSGNVGDSPTLDGQDTVYGGSAREYIATGYGNDRIYAGPGDDYIDAGPGRDFIYGEDGDDFIVSGGAVVSIGWSGGTHILRGGRGNDTIFLDYEDDNVYFDIGDGQDFIRQYSGSRSLNSAGLDWIYIENVTSRDIDVSREDANLVIQYSQSDSITVLDFFVREDSEWVQRDAPTFIVRLPDGDSFDIRNHVADLLKSNTAPVAADDELTIPANYPYILYLSDLIGNDTDADGDTLKLYEVTNPINGQVTYDLTINTIIFIPNKGFEGSAGFDYTIDDDNGGISTASVNLTLVDNLNAQSGTPADETLVGSDSADSLFGRDGDDQIIGGRGNDILVGGKGDDVINAGAGDDILYLVFGNNGSDYINGGEGFDSLYGNDLIHGGSIDDEFWIDTIIGLELINGGEGVNRIRGNEEDNVIDLSDTLLVNIDSIDAGFGNDTVIGSELSEQTILGSRGDDTLIGGNANDTILGGADNDWIVGGAGSDNLNGNEGDDDHFGGEGGDYFQINSGRDLFVGQDGNDIYYWQAGAGNDYISDYAVVDAGDPRHADILVLNGSWVDGQWQELRFSDFTWSRNEFDALLITLNSTNETITIFNWFRDQDNRLSKIIGDEEFDIAQIESAANANVVTTSVASSASSLQGTAQQIYSYNCASCHGGSGDINDQDNGRGEIPISGEIGNGPIEALRNYIELTMPLRDAGACIDNCATELAQLIQSWGLPLDADRDGVDDSQDQCSTTPNNEITNSNGCSGSQIDSDSDGVSDLDDICENTAVLPVDELGCSLDTDGDGVFDGVDNCADTPMFAIVDAQGCPLDADNDGVFDGLDTCPNTPNGEPVDSNGCADTQKDSDNDSVNDALDQCPGTNFGWDVDAEGCAEYQIDDDNDGVADISDDCLGTAPGANVNNVGCEVIDLLSSDGTFSSGQENFNTFLPAGSSTTWDDEVSFDITTDTEEAWQVQLSHELNLSAGFHTVCYLAKSDDVRTISTSFDEGAPSYGFIGGGQVVQLSTNYAVAGMTVNVGGTYENARLVFNLGGSDINVQLDDIVVFEGVFSCSSLYTDDDNDGVINTMDNCPNTPLAESVDSQGCSATQRDADDDGVSDAVDTCPMTPAGATVDAVGCPSDSDNDGVLDGIDLCDNTSSDDVIDSLGCGDTQKDDDNDGLNNALDMCPGTPEGAPIDADGCSAGQGDDDGDGIDNLSDQCPNTPISDTVDSVGCTVLPDADADGVPDSRDICSGTIADAAVDVNGCVLINSLIVEAEDYIDANDSDPINNADDPTQCTYNGLGVDVQDAFDDGGGCNIGWAEGGEWLEYTVDLSEGTYDITARFASDVGGGEYEVLLDGDVIGSGVVGDTNGWQTYEDFAVGSFATNAGQFTLRFNVNAGGFNFNWIRFDATSLVIDTDQDGVIDANDLCENTPANKLVDVDGCVLVVDSDGDGVDDPSDQCANTPSGVIVDHVGCPLDSDNDGVFDGLDNCADTPATAPVDSFGCALDSDNDGVIDLDDQCANTDAGATVDAFGCELPDSDNDGVYDVNDLCANTPSNETANADGCSPSQLDSDNDGVNDLLDQCANTPIDETPDENGCALTQLDSDNDGVNDLLDQCSNTPEAESANNDGCSPSQLDSDEDGVSDADDLCANTPENESVNIHGCSDTQIDTDGDGINDANDQCANTPLIETADSNGCSPSQKDSDSDGVNDAIDQCPTTPNGETADASGCSDSERDTDSDGVVDANDTCPMTPAGATVDAKGCPSDTDGDGVLDGLDICANTPVGASVNASGCPSDSDSDGVFDGIDQCASTPSGAIVDALGCPLDADNDGIFDGLDQCSNTPSNETADAAGCSPSQKDDDNDGVNNAIDVCANTPNNEIANAQGCAPSQLDSDSDGVTDDIDQCAGTPLGSPVDAQGCLALADEDADGVPDIRDQCSGTPSGQPVDVDGCVLISSVVVEAENYIAANDSDAGNNGDVSQCTYNGMDVDVQDATDIGGGCNVGWTNEGEWLEYSVTLSAGTYDVTTRVASQVGGTSSTLLLNGVEIGTDIVDATGGWQAWETHNVGSVTVNAGEHTLRVNLNGGAINFNWVTFTASNLIVDSDQDGVIDEDDLCANTEANILVGADGCPLVVDTDNDGVTDDVDQCADTPASVLVDSNGCPTDADGDGIFDGLDQCNTTPEGAPIDAVGCALDSDNDGVIDLIDLCANTSVGARVDADGCELPDTDDDGIYDIDDSCPATPTGETVNGVGCSSSQIDSDNDGVMDNADQCANTPNGETVNSEGCSSSQIDTDNDGVMDDVDQCENTPELETADSSGCSSSQIDSDNDGIFDNLDQCANTPIDETAGSDGCSPSQTDTDGDGIFDNDDQCENTPIVDTANAEGCSPSQIDSDEDGVMDNADQCANTPSDETANIDGCSPSQIDTDNDGVSDATDTCPMTPAGATVDAVGCPSDMDNDTVLDGIDQCANTPVGATVNAIGCPSDSDSDGVFDGLDQCANTPVGAVVNTQGCPSDTDGDGIFDGLDQCANTPNGALVNGNGCPSDSDNDGVFDGIDQCSATPTGALVDILGCPIDNDNDGIFDGLDQCANTPNGETADANGCAESQKDDDGDNVNNALDDCPNTPNGETVNVNGCAASELDTDNDGVTDNLDQCPGTPLGTTVDATGCLAAADVDADGVPDFRDLCNSTPVNTDVDVDGCALINTVKVEAESYIAAQDNDGGNNGTPSQCTYNGMDVDVQDATDVGGGCNIGWTGEGEWLEYELDLSAGTYQVTTRVASDPGGTGATLLLNGVEIGTDNVGPTGGWQVWETHVVGTVDVTAGTHTLRVNLNGGGLNLNWITFTATDLLIDTDQDGITDDIDQCANTPSGTVVDSDGCAVVVDSDGDGVLDNIDQCPGTPSGVLVDSDGCALPDADDDGIPDINDLCENTPLGESVNVSGCSQTQLDDDSDGVNNAADKCPATPSGETPDADGCSSSQLDSDNDGVMDNMDQCADTPNIELADANGCSDSQKDSDIDGVNDALDQCANTPNGETANAAGCSPTQLDDDNDGISNALDTCADTPLGATVDVAGCPSDSDSDGIFDGIDQCLNTPVGALVDALGCSSDTDNDGVFDGIDTCEFTAPGARVDSSGCELPDTDGDGVYDVDDLCEDTPLDDIADANGCGQTQLDDDNDGINNALDNCANTPNGETANAQGCSASQVDSDNDGVFDNEDNCANTPNGETVNASGCSSSQIDSDNDGVMDNLDQCANTPTGETANAAGCSNSQIDTDQDGVSDALDQCSNTESGVVVDSVGCGIDSDADGVFDGLDQCANTPNGETANALGCSASQTDADSDGVSDASDLCADTPSNETADMNGCSPSQRDSDNDGVNDALDICENTPLIETANSVGCSPSQLDTDGDGVTDDIDNCANTPNAETANVDGCSPSQLDSDNDGVSDAVDVCVSTPEGETVDANGCALIELDSDSDGVNDALDQCPNTAANDGVNAAGCAPVQLDSDGDGVNDAIDQCPATEEGATVDAAGCAPSAVEIARIEAENYVAANDSSAGNSGAPTQCVYQGMNVDVENTSDVGGGCNVGWTSDGEWLEYNVANAGGTYNVTVRLAGMDAGNQVQLLVNDVAVGTVSTNGGGWQNWDDYTVNNVAIPDGATLRVQFLNGGINFNYLDFDLVSSGGGDVPNATYNANDIGIGGCTGAAACTSASWGIDLNGDTGFEWANVSGGSSGGSAELYLTIAVPGGNRAMSVWVNGVQVGTIASNDAESPRPTGAEFGPFAVGLNAGNNSVELRDTEGTAEFDVHSARVVGL